MLRITITISLEESRLLDALVASGHSISRSAVLRSGLRAIGNSGLINYQTYQSAVMSQTKYKQRAVRASQLTIAQLRDEARRRAKKQQAASQQLPSGTSLDDCPSTPS